MNSRILLIFLSPTHSASGAAVVKKGQAASVAAKKGATKGKGAAPSEVPLAAWIPTLEGAKPGSDSSTDALLLKITKMNHDLVDKLVQAQKQERVDRAEEVRQVAPKRRQSSIETPARTL